MGLVGCLCRSGWQHLRRASVAERSSVSDSHDPYQALRFGGFRLLLTGIFIAGLGERMIDVALGWELYERTGSALVLGGVGLALVIPVIVLSLPAGHIIDRFNRKYIVIISQIVLALVSLGLTALSFTRGSLVLIYGCLVLYGCAAAFNSPAASTLVPQVVEEKAFENAATWDSGVGQLASVLGPALGGLLIAVLGGATLVYAINAGVILVFVCLPFFLREISQAAPRPETTTLQSLGEGLKFLRSTQVILASITLDMFAVMLGGCITVCTMLACTMMQHS